MSNNRRVQDFTGSELMRWKDKRVRRSWKGMPGRLGTSGGRFPHNPSPWHHRSVAHKQPLWAFLSSLAECGAFPVLWFLHPQRLQPYSERKQLIILSFIFSHDYKKILFFFFLKKNIPFKKQDFSALPALKTTFYSFGKTRNVGIYLFPLMENCSLAENLKNKRKKSNNQSISSTYKMRELMLYHCY